MKKKLLSLVVGTVLAAVLLAGCGGSASETKKMETKSSEEKVFNYGTTAYGVAMENAGMNPHDSYKG